MHRFVFRSPRLGFLAVGPALARPAAAFYRRNRAAFAPFDPVQPEDFFTEEGQAERLAEELGGAELPLPAGTAPAPGQNHRGAGLQRDRPGSLPVLLCVLQNRRRPLGAGLRLRGHPVRHRLGLPGAGAPPGGGQRHAPQRRLPAGGGESGLPARGAGPALSQHQRRVGGPHPHGQAQ